jgi:hypothetical protein
VREQATAVASEFLEAADAVQRHQRRFRCLRELRTYLARPTVAELIMQLGREPVSSTRRSWTTPSMICARIARTRSMKNIIVASIPFRRGAGSPLDCITCTTDMIL